MSDLFSLLNRTVRSLDAARYGLDVAGQNIANVNTPGYVRRSAQLAEIAPLDANSSGGGVDVVAVTASRAPLVEARLRYERPAASREGATAEHLAIVEAGLGQPGQSLDAALARFYNTYDALAQNPTSTTSRQQVILEGQTLSRGFYEMSTRFDDANRAADADIRATVVQINVLAQQLADINRQIATTDGQNAEGLKDQQAEVIKSLGNLIDVGVIERADGTADLSVGNGRALVIGDNVYDLQITPSSGTGFAQILTNGGSVTTDITTEIAGGRMGGLIRVRDTLVPGYQSQLDQLAYKISNDVNAVVTTGYDLNGNAGLDFFTPPTAVQGAARAMSVNSAVAANTDLIVAAGTTAPGNNSIARAVGQLQDTALTGGTATPLQAWGNLVYSVATDASKAEQTKKGHDQVIVQLENLRDQVAGISLDEEAAFMLRFQRAYEANARFFQTIDQTLDLLMQIANRL